MNGFELRRKRKMDDILDAAFELFKNQGIKSTSVNSIAEKAKVSPVSIFNFFGSKENLVKQVVFRVMDEGIRDFESIVKSDLTFREKAKKILQFSDDETYATINDDIISFNIESDPQMIKFFEEIGNTKTIPLYMELIEHGKQEGAIDKSLSPSAVLLFINSVSAALRTAANAKERIDLGKLLYYGLFGNAENE
ncbi:TetR/AcrR family transcriptional regulator [Sedimentibacter sp.]|uniref:TetR/AcrR family transcriptional regulator n=1 Tax=Sedimentibacter sp. TaxID=1960295 RepID=UPI0028ABE7AA|nr:TetR/AcrR family transcriptional regulator [Sedimentibacter sp.]